MSDPSQVTSADLIGQHILKCLETHSQIPSHSKRLRPLFVGLQGPQGVGKTTLTRNLFKILEGPPHSLKLAILSLDDLYLSHSGLIRLAEKYPSNGLLQGRGQPGTHDVDLGETILDAFNHINDPDAKPVEIPIFDKSLFNGEGDRLPSGIVVQPPVHVFILEGWSMGFYPLSSEELERKYQEITAKEVGDVVAGEPDVSSIIRKHSLEDLLLVNTFLLKYVEKLYPLFDAFAQVQG